MDTEHLQGVGTSHTLALVDEVMSAVESAGREQFGAYVAGAAGRTARFGLLTHALNRMFEPLGFHIARASYARDVGRALGDRFGAWRCVAAVRAMLSAPGDFDGVYRVLTDDDSRSVFDWLVRARTAVALGGQAALQMYSAPADGAKNRSTESVRPRRQGAGYLVEGIVVESDSEAVLDCFVREQYRCEGRVEVHEGDVVLDLGAYKGESAVWLARRAGHSGLVLALEPNPAVQGALKRNIAHAVGAGSARIEVLAVAAGASRRRAGFVSTAASCSMLDDKGDIAVDVGAVDDIVSDRGLASVDFIKMDIEGGEVDALKGARQTIRRFAPRLAISVYHRARDLPDVVAAIGEARPDYQFFLSHKSPGLSETVLFAAPLGSGGK